ncbi:hypothetical protein CHGG_01267 [Chaetomium globosum CBS 148.51]|uniref:Lytic polysaccharide monooxygenase n=1 Tax=Chaetomium globosum (strain ATCC 6205 / CBS 148.51 / DSM 1962 / NBRC 6347 / NRRL 1970) TaxID=306901 RepID=Q2HET7_CHAGB|nr:uncharacterized protein CHGG_01267 [Chaetomium globosum CBS 148.51]EAQ93032.1 hypothetical protein CHGG_01267 [Chaetomium globosum CBS 148.51]
MMSPIVSAAGVAMLLLRGAHGHMVMNSPTPYNLDIQPLLQVDPISGGLYPYPCHNQYGFTHRTPVEAGGATLVNFTGGGQHGGGSCQFSITYDEPINGEDWNKSASFKTIYSIIGGCPAVFTDESHNLATVAVDENKRQDGKHCGNDSGVDCIRQFMIPIPKFLKNGPATFAWTWFNKLGNKEMYMNCAPIKITGGTGNETEIENLPNIFVANYPNDPEVTNCITGTRSDNVVVNFPEPGKYGRVLQDPVEPVNKPSGYCTQIPPARSLPTFEPGLTLAATPVGKAGPATTTPTPPVEDTTSPALGHSANDPITESAEVTTPVPTLTRSPPPIVIPANITTTIMKSSAIDLGVNPTPLTTPTPTPTPAAVGTGAIAKKPNSKAVACPSHGSIVCLDDGTFGLCDWGWVMPQRVAAGTECKEGKIVKRDEGNLVKRGGGEDY